MTEQQQQTIFSTLGRYEYIKHLILKINAFEDMSSDFILFQSRVNAGLQNDLLSPDKMQLASNYFKFIAYELVSENSHLRIENLLPVLKTFKINPLVHECN